MNSQQLLERLQDLDLQGLHIQLLDLPLDLVLEHYAREDLPCLVVPALSKKEWGQLRHEEQKDNKHDREEDIVAVGDAPAIGYIGEEDIDRCNKLYKYYNRY